MTALAPRSLPLAGGRTLVLDRPLVMGILNVTPDSFSDGGELTSPAAVAARAIDMLDAGADILDVGGESTRPGAAPVPADVEEARIAPAIGAIRAARPDAVISIDTSKASVARAALVAGADFVNDVSGLGDPHMARVVRDADCAVVLMRWDDGDGDIVEHTRTRLAALLERAVQAGIARAAVVLDPGLGFGARPGADPADNLAIVRALPRLVDLGCPILVGASRKRFIGAVTGEPEPARRLGGSVAVAVAAVLGGAAIVRVHDVGETVQAVRVAAALLDQ